MGDLTKDWPHGYEIAFDNGCVEPAKILTWERPGGNNIVAMGENGVITFFSASGRQVSQTLRNAPAPKRSGTVWLNIYSDEREGMVIRQSRQMADEYAEPSRIACVEVNWTEGEGLP